MAFTLVTAQTLLARNAGVLYGLELGTVDMAAYSLQMGTTPVAQAAFLNSVYAASVGSATVAAVAAQVVTGVGILSTNTAVYQIGIDYVTSELNKGTVATRGSIINDIITLFSNATTDANLGTLAIAFNNKITNALTFAGTTGSVTNSNFTSVPTTIAASTGTTFTLTTGVDNVTSASTVVSGTVDQLLGTNSTWTIGDTVASAANSTANMTLLTNGTNAVGLSATGVATLNVKVVDQNAAATNSGLDVASFTDLKTLKIANSATLGTTILTTDTFSVTGLAAGDIISLDTNGQFTNTSFTFASAATQGSADTVTLQVAGRNGGLNVATGFETAAITTTGTTARIAALSTSTAKTLTVAGTGLKIDSTLDTTLTSIDASTSTGNVDIFVTGATTLTSIKAGAGTADKLTANALSTANIVSGFEQINAATAATYDLTGVTGATKLGIDAAATTGTVTFTNVAATTNALSFSGGNQRTTAADTTSSITTGSVTYTLKTATGTSDALTITVDNAAVASTGTYAAGTLVISGLEVVTFTATDWKANSFTGITDTVGSTGNLAFTATATATNLTFGTVLIAGGGTSGNTFNLSAVTGTTSETFTGTDNFTFSGGTGVDTFTTGAVANLLTQTYNAGAGNDVITVAAVATTGTLNINADAGDDTIVLAANVAQTGAGTFNVDGGAGTLDTIKVTGGTSVINTMVGIEKISVQAIVTTTIAASSVLANNTVEITQIAAGTVAFTATASQTANISGVTQVGNAILTLTSAAGATAEILTGSSTVGTTFNSGAGADTITGGAGNDIINGGAGADVINVSTGTDTISLRAGITATPSNGDSAVHVATGGGINTITTVGRDIITGMGAADIIQLASVGGYSGNAGAALGLVANGTALNTIATTDGADNAIVLVRGTYSSTADTFVGGAAGLDSYLIYDANATVGATVYEAIVLVGYSGAGGITGIGGNAGVVTLA